MSHSFGAVVFMTFLSWVETQSPGWVDAHLHAYINLAGTLLGVPKAIAPMLSGACVFVCVLRVGGVGNVWNLLRICT
jgi:hypothetical protein